MSISEFKTYRKARDEAQARAKDLTAYVKENTSHIKWPEGQSPDEMEGQITQVFYESEKDALDREKK
jgi:uncharacterized coiled-coil DUF342 family protein